MLLARRPFTRMPEPRLRGRDEDDDEERGKIEDEGNAKELRGGLPGLISAG